MKITFSDKVPVSKTMHMEKCFHPNLAMSYRDKLHILNQTKMVVWMFVNDFLVGETYGVWPYQFDEEIEGLQKYRNRQDCLYIYSIAITKSFQGRGLGRVLKAFSLGLAKEQGCEIVLGHTLAGPSTKLTLSFGGKVIKSFNNWYGTGQVAYLCRTLLT